MTRTDFTASSRPQAAATATSVKVPSRRRPARRILAATVVLALMGPTSAAFAAETGTSNYNQTPPVKTTPATTTPSNGTGPSRSSSAPKQQSAPATVSTTPSTSSNSTLPFTGLDLRWIIGAGVLLMGAGLSLRGLQRRDASR